jgi:hypothetical protein
MTVSRLGSLTNNLVALNSWALQMTRQCVANDENGAAKRIVNLRKFEPLVWTRVD